MKSQDSQTMLVFIKFYVTEIRKQLSMQMGRMEKNLDAHLSDFEQAEASRLEELQEEDFASLSQTLDCFFHPFWA